MHGHDIQLVRAIHEERVRRMMPRAVSDVRWRRRAGSPSGSNHGGMPREHGDR